MQLTFGQIFSLYQPITNSKQAAIARLVAVPLTAKRRHLLKTLLAKLNETQATIENERAELIQRYGALTQELEERWEVELASQSGQKFMQEWSEYLTLTEDVPDFRLTEDEAEHITLTLQEEALLQFVLPSEEVSQ